MIRIEDLKPGMMIIPEGRKRPVEVMSVDNWNNAAVYQIGHLGTGFNVSSVPAGGTVRLAG